MSVPWASTDAFTDAHSVRMSVVQPVRVSVPVVFVRQYMECAYEPNGRGGTLSPLVPLLHALLPLPLPLSLCPRQVTAQAEIKLTLYQHPRPALTVASSGTKVSLLTSPRLLC
eukprot:864079-Rhodomonas_salina.1